MSLDTLSLYIYPILPQSLQPSDGKRKKQQPYKVYSLLLARSSGVPAKVEACRETCSSRCHVICEFHDPKPVTSEDIRHQVAPPAWRPERGSRAGPQGESRRWRNQDGLRTFSLLSTETEDDLEDLLQEFEIRATPRAPTLSEDAEVSAFALGENLGGAIPESATWDSNPAPPKEDVLTTDPTTVSGKGDLAAPALSGNKDGPSGANLGLASGKPSPVSVLDVAPSTSKPGALPASLGSVPGDARVGEKPSSVALSPAAAAASAVAPLAVAGAALLSGKEAAEPSNDGTKEPPKKQTFLARMLSKGLSRKVIALHPPPS